MTELEKIEAEKQKLDAVRDRLGLEADEVRDLLGDVAKMVQTFGKTAGRTLAELTRLAATTVATTTDSGDRQKKYVSGLLLRGICPQCGKNPKSDRSKRYCDECLEMFRTRARSKKAAIIPPLPR